MWDLTAVWHFEHVLKAGMHAMVVSKCMLALDGHGIETEHTCCLLRMPPAQLFQTSMAFLEGSPLVRMRTALLCLSAFCQHFNEIKACTSAQRYVLQGTAYA